MENFSKPFLEAMLKWLGYDGVAFFQMCLDTYGTLICVWMDNRFPHPVHFREGMQVRNWMRGWDRAHGIEFNDHYYDDHWEETVMKALELCHAF